MTACIATIRGRSALATVFAAANQTRPPDRTILLDSTPAKDALCLDRMASEMVAFTGTEYHFDESGVDVQEARRYMAEQALTEWLWFLDDDMLPWHDCLQAMIACANYHRTDVVTATTHNLIPQALPTGGVYPAEGPDNVKRPLDRQLFEFGTACLLVRRRAWLDADLSYAPDAAGGEDRFVTSQIAAGRGGYVSARALTVHVRQRRPSWTNRKPRPEWAIKLRNLLTPEAWNRRQNSVGAGSELPPMPEGWNEREEATDEGLYAGRKGLDV